MRGGTIAGVLSRAEATQQAILALALAPRRHRRGAAMPTRELSVVARDCSRLAAVLAVAAPGVLRARQPARPLPRQRAGPDRRDRHDAGDSRRARSTSRSDRSFAVCGVVAGVLAKARAAAAGCRRSAPCAAGAALGAINGGWSPTLAFRRSSSRWRRWSRCAMGCDG